MPEFKQTIYANPDYIIHNGVLTTLLSQVHLQLPNTEDELFSYYLTRKLIDTAERIYAYYTGEASAVPRPFNAYGVNLVQADNLRIGRAVVKLLAGTYTAENRLHNVTNEEVNLAWVKLQELARILLEKSLGISFNDES
jgi:hypothetical protein